jgi:hypothetical protein
LEREEKVETKGEGNRQKVETESRSRRWKGQCGLNLHSALGDGGWNYMGPKEKQSDTTWYFNF